MLDAADVPGFLLERRLLDARDVVRGGLRVSDSSRLNRVFLVTAHGRRSLVVKAGARVGREAAVLQRLHRAGHPGLTAFLPSIAFADPGRGVLVLESPAEARDVTRHHARGRFSRALARNAGRGLAALHGTPCAVLHGLRPPGDRGSALRVHLPDVDVVHEMTPAARELTRNIQGLDDLCAALDRIASSPREDAVIHGDVRWDNVIAAREPSSRRWTRLELIDWELCDAGDPAVDVGAFLGEYLRAWAQSVPVMDPLDPAPMLAGAGVPLRRMRPALRAFWEAYARGTGASADELATLLRRAMDLAAVRLLTAALEEAQAADHLPARVLRLVPLSRNLLCRRDHAPARLLGLDAPGGP